MQKHFGLLVYDKKIFQRLDALSHHSLDATEYYFPSLKHLYNASPTLPTLGRGWDLSGWKLQLNIF